MFIKPNAQLEALLAHQREVDRRHNGTGPDSAQKQDDQACQRALSDECLEEKLDALRLRVTALRAEIKELERRVISATSSSPFFNYFWLFFGCFLLLLGVAGAGGVFAFFGVAAICISAFSFQFEPCRTLDRTATDEQLKRSREDLHRCRQEIGQLVDEKRAAAKEAAVRAAIEREQERAKQEKIAAQRHQEAEQRRKEAERRIAQKRQTLDYWLGLDGHKFEREFASLLEQNGWKAEVTKASGDGGIDIVATSPAREKTAIQCKRWKNRVGAPYVRDLKGAASVGGFDRMIVIGTGGFTTDAESFAVIAGVELWDKDSLYSLISASK